MTLQNAVRAGLSKKKVRIKKDDWLYDMDEPGNIDLTNRPVVQTKKGPATVRSMSFGEGKREVMVPTVEHGKEMSDDEAIEEYRKTGKHLGKFRSIKGAVQYGKRLHEAYQNKEIPGYK
jgi:hypothetical protein